MTPPTPTVHWRASLADVPPPDWNRIFGTTVAVKGLPLAQAVEDARIQNLTLLYLTAALGDEIAAIIPAFILRARLDLLSPPRVRAVAQLARRIFPKFLTRRILFLGSPLATCDHLLGIGIADDDPRLPGLVARIKAALHAKASEQRCPIIMAKDFRARDRERLARMLGPEFLWMETLPNAFIPVGEGLPPYPASLRHKYRNNVARTLAESGHTGLIWKCSPDFAALAPEMGRLYAQVLSRSQTPLERLDERFFRAVATRCRDTALALTCATPGGQLVCFWLALEDPRTLCGLYMGMDYSHPHAGHLYPEGTFRLVREAERRGKRALFCGQNAMLPKAHAGAVFERIWLAVLPRNPIWAAALRAGLHRIPPPCQIPRIRCYTDHAAAAISARLAADGIPCEPLKTTADSGPASA